MDSIQNINQSVINSVYMTEEKRVNEMDREAFLKLFVESLKHQNPLEPMEQSEMMAQITNLALMESVENLKGIIEQFVGISESSNGLMSGVHLIGKYVEIENSEGRFEGTVKSVGRQMNEFVLELDDGNFYLVDTVVGVRETKEKVDESE